MRVPTMEVNAKRIRRNMLNLTVRRSSQRGVLRVVSLPPFFMFISPPFDDFVKSRNQTAKKKDPDARRANPEE
jgi:hypothetical protein